MSQQRRSSSRLRAKARLNYVDGPNTKFILDLPIARKQRNAIKKSQEGSIKKSQSSEMGLLVNKKSVNSKQKSANSKTKMQNYIKGQRKLEIKLLTAGQNEDVIGINVCGSTKGQPGGLPKYQFRSIYQYDITRCLNNGETPWKSDPRLVPSQIIPNILSVVTSVKLGCKLDLEKISKSAYNLHYNPDQFLKLVMRLKNPSATAMIFESGHVVVSGTKSEEESRIATRRFARIIQKLGYRVSVAGMIIQNITAIVHLGFRVRVHELANTTLVSRPPVYHPELFNGISVPVHLSSSSGRVVVFQTGAALITGVKSEKEVHEALKFIYPLAKLYAN